MTSRLPPITGKNVSEAGANIHMRRCDVFEHAGSANVIENTLAMQKGGQMQPVARL